MRQYDAEIENYPSEELDNVLQKFYAEVRTKKGEDYEPDSLKGMQAALDRHLKNKNYSCSIIRDREFYNSKQILEGKARQLRENGRGKRPNAAKPLTLQEEEMLWEKVSLRTNGSFYLAPLSKTTPNNDIWFKEQNLGVHSIYKIMKTMIADTPLASSCKRLTNHSARKTVVKKLRLNNVERSSIMNVTGHRNEQSLNDYDEGNENEQRHISNLIGNSKSASSLCKQKPMSMNMMNIVPPAPSTQQPSTSSGFERLGLFPRNTFNHCNVVFNVGESSSSPKVELRRYKRIVIDSKSDSQE